MDTMQLIMTRKSVRTFDRKPLTAEDLEKLQAFSATIENPYGIPVEFVFLDAEEHGLSSKVIQGESLYFAAKVEVQPNYEMAYGYSFEEFVLYAWSLGIGTTWIAGTLDRPLFENAAQVKPGESMICVSPLGYPAARKSLVETALRKGVKGDHRLPASKLFFEGDFSTPLNTDDEFIGNTLEAVHWAPSAANKQPCRVVKVGNAFHFYEAHDKGYATREGLDLQKVDMGIALCHFMKMAGGELTSADPGIEAPENTEYLFTVTV